MRCLPSRGYVWAGFGLWVLAVAAGWTMVCWPAAIFVMSALLLSSLVLVLLGLRPSRLGRGVRHGARRPQAVAPPPPRREPDPVRYPLLRPEDEEEVERLYQRLKSVGRLDWKSPSDET